MAQRDDRKRLGKKHRQASTRPKQGRAQRTTPTTGAVNPRKRKSLSTKRTQQEKKKRTPTRSPENESRRTIAPKSSASKPRTSTPKPSPTPTESPAEIRAWRDAEILAAQLDLAADSAASRALPLIAICGRPNVGKSTLFNRLTGSRRSIVGDEPGITRDRIYGLIEWQSADARLVDTGGIVPDDPELIPAEIFLQAQTALSEAQVVIMVIDGRTELASPDIALARRRKLPPPRLPQRPRHLRRTRHRHRRPPRCGLFGTSSRSLRRPPPPVRHSDSAGVRISVVVIPQRSGGICFFSTDH
jgi:GTP-binding protein